MTTYGESLVFRLGAVVALLLVGQANTTASAQDSDLTIETFYEDLEVPGDSGIEISIGGVSVGQTDPDGVLTVLHPPGLLVIRAEEPGLVAGTAEIAADPGAVLNVKIVMGSEGNLVYDAELRVDQASYGALNLDFDALTLRMVAPNGSTVPISAVDSIAYSALDGSAYSSLDSFFELQNDGSLEATSVDGVRAIIEAGGPEYLFEFRGEGIGGRILGGTVRLPEPSSRHLLVVGVGLLCALFRLRASARAAR